MRRSAGDNSHTRLKTDPYSHISPFVSRAVLCVFSIRHTTSLPTCPNADSSPLCHTPCFLPMPPPHVSPPPPPPPSPTRSTPQQPAQSGCEWLKDGAVQLDGLPDFPPFPSSLRLDEGGSLGRLLLPIPRLLPSWERLHSLVPSHRAALLAAAAPTDGGVYHGVHGTAPQGVSPLGTPLAQELHADSQGGATSAASLVAGGMAGAGFAAGALFVAYAYAASKRQRAKPSLRRGGGVRHGGGVRPGGGQ